MADIDLNDIGLFVTVVQAGSFSKAADITNIPKSRLSRRISRLEADLGTALMGRSKKGVVLNEVGKQFYLDAQKMMQAAQIAVGSVQGRLETPNGLLRMSVSTEIARAMLAPHLAEYLQRYPQVDLDIDINNKKINMIQDGIDIVLRIGAIDDENVVARRLREMELGLFASRDYLAQKGTPQSPHELPQHILLNKKDGVEWRFAHKEHLVHIQTNYKIASNDANLLEKMTADGVGIALLPVFNPMHPALVRLLPQWRIEKAPLHIVYYKNRGAVPTVRSMVDFLLEKLGEK